MDAVASIVGCIVTVVVGLLIGIAVVALIRNARRRTRLRGGSIIGYFFGSSSGSKGKDDLLNFQMRSAPPGPSPEDVIDRIAGGNAVKEAIINHLVSHISGATPSPVVSRVREEGGGH